MESRGFILLHQHNVLDVDDSGNITATAHLTIQPTASSLRAVYLNAAPELVIQGVSLSSPGANPLLSTPATYTHVQPYHLPVREPPLDISSHVEIKRRSWAAAGEKDEGELAILVTNGWIRLNDESTGLAVIEIKVDYLARTGEDVSYDAARYWTPCVDSLWDRCTWELDIIVPSGQTAVATGELQEQVVHPHTPRKTIFSYLQTNPTSVQHVGFSIGAFELHEIEPKLLAFCNADDLELVESISFMSRAMAFVGVLGSYPFQDFKLVFTDIDEVKTYSTMAIFPRDLLHPSQAIECRQTLSLALIQQWMGFSIIPRTLSDTWLVNGLALYIHSLFLKELFGNNEYRFRLKRDIDRCVRADQGGKAPICVPGCFDLDIPFINLKAPLVLHLLDRYLAKAGTSLGLTRIIPRVLLAALSDELSGNTLSTPWFMRICRKLSGMDLSTLEDQWILGSGCPTFRLQTNFIRKKFLVEFQVTQSHPTGVLYEGSLTVRIHEADGAPFEHVVDVKQQSKVFQLPFNTKYKRTRRSGRMAARFNQLQEDLVDEPLPTGAFVYPPWDDEDERREWRVAEWTDDQATAMLQEGSGYEWFRVDPDCEWLAAFEFTEKPWYWISQLQGDRDVIAQLEAIHNLALYPYPVVASELARTVLVSNFFYRIRMAAAKALVLFNTAECDYLGKFYLVKLFYSVKGGLQDTYVRNSIIAALGDLRDPATRSTYLDVRSLLLEALKTQDNPPATLISAVGNAFSAGGDSRELSALLDRALTTDRLVPSFGNEVTRAALESLLKMVLAGHRTNDPHLFLAYSREGNYEPLRLLAFDCLLLCKPPGRSLNLLKYLFDVIRFDRSARVRRHVARSLPEAILASLAMGEVTTEADDHNAIVKAVRKEMGKRVELRQMLQDALLSYRVDYDVHFSLLKAAEIVSSSQKEPSPGTIITIQTPVVETPKIRISLDRPDYFPPQPIKLSLTQPKKVPKAQSKGLSATDVIAISSALKKMRGDTRSVPFRQPVDPIRDGAADYLTVIKQPMDLSTIAAKLDSGMYAKRQDFVDDVRLVIRNCFDYNRKGSPMHRAGQAFEQFFSDLWEKTEATLKGATESSTTSTPKVTLIRRPTLDTQVAPMAPPPVPPKKVEKAKPKRKSPDVADLLGEEVDAAEAQAKKSKPDPVVHAAPALPVRRPPADVPPTSTNSLPFKQRRAKALVGVLTKDPNAIFFLRPVDPIADGCPTYLDEIRHPMDLGTISKKIEAKKYKTMGDLARDVELIFANCRQFNPPGEITALADRLEEVYWKQWRTLGASKMLPEEKKAMTQLLGRAVKEDVSFFFREAVDPVALNIPQYFDIIPRADARDLSLIKSKMDSYQSAKEVDDDISLMLENAVSFNGDGPVVEAANSFGRWWKQQRAKME